MSSSESLLMSFQTLFCGCWTQRAPQGSFKVISPPKPGSYRLWAPFIICTVPWSWQLHIKANSLYLQFSSLHHPPKFPKLLHPKSSSSVIKHKMISPVLGKYLVIVDIAMITKWSTTYDQVTLWHLSVSQVPPRWCFLSPSSTLLDSLHFDLKTHFPNRDDVHSKASLELSERN